MAGLLVMFGAIILGYMQPPQDWSLIVLALIYQCFFSFATALLAASLSEMSDLVEKFVSVISYLSLPFSGAFIMVTWLPLRYQWILMLSPMANNMEMMRGGQFGLEASVRYDLFYDTWMTGLLLLVGIILTADVRKHLEITG